MKVGDKVTIRDYSWSMCIRNERVERTGGCLHPPYYCGFYDKAEVLAHCGLVLPQPPLKSSLSSYVNRPTNNTIIRRLEDGLIIFIADKFLKVVK